MKKPEPIEVVAYDPAWPVTFQELKERLSRSLGDVALAIEHVGSTAVPGLPAKPVIDIDIVVKPADVPAAIACLATIGYVHVGNRGIEGREAFNRPPGLPAHHLYVCPEDSEELKRHISFRDHLRAHPDDAAAYGKLKLALAKCYRNDRVAYTDSKAPFIQSIMAKIEG